MDKPTVETTQGAPRRDLFAGLAGATALGIAGVVSAAADARADAAPSETMNWPGKLKGRHRQVVDGYNYNNGSPLDYTFTFLATNKAPGAASAVLVLRAGAFPLALNSAMWAKYKVGETLKINDPETKAPAVKNPFLHPAAGVLISDGVAIDRLLAAGAVMGACNFALHGFSRKLAVNAGVSADDAAREFAANLVPGVTLIPAGTWGVNRAQEAGCTYCAGG